MIPRDLPRALAAAMCSGLVLVPAALGADATQCPDDHPLGGWMRYQSTFHFLPTGWLGASCDIDTTQLLSFDMLQEGPHFTRQTIEATLPPTLKGATRDNLVQQMLNQANKHPLIDLYHVSQLRYQVRQAGCSSDAITGMRAATVSGTLVLGEDSPSGFREGPHTVPMYMYFNAMNPEIVSFGSLAQLDAVKRALSMRGEAKFNSAGDKQKFEGFPPFWLPRIQPTTKPHRPDASGQAITGCPSAACFQVEPTKCAQPYGSHLPAECQANPAKYAVIPFEGKSDWHVQTPPDHGPAGWFVSSAISWKICCGCGQGQPPPDFPQQPCPDSTNKAGLNRSQRAAKVKDLSKLWESYEEEMKKAQSHLSQLQTTIKQCRIQSVVSKVLMGTLALYSPLGQEAVFEAAEDSVEEAEAIEQVVKMVGPQVADPGSTFFTVVSKLMSGEDPTANLIPNETYQQLLEFSEVANQLSAFFNPNVAQLEEQVQSCAGTIHLSDEDWKGANEYVEELKAAMEKVPDVQKLVNDIRQLDTALPSLQFDDYSACVRRARCLKQPESSCASLKPAGNWPDVP